MTPAATPIATPPARLVPALLVLLLVGELEAVVLNGVARLEMAADTELATEMNDDEMMLAWEEREDKKLEAGLVTVLRGRKRIKMGTSDWGKMIQTMMTMMKLKMG